MSARGFLLVVVTALLTVAGNLLMREGVVRGGGLTLSAATVLRGLFHRHYWEIPVKEGNVILLVPAELDQPLNFDALTARAEALAPRLGYSLQPLLDVLRPAS